MIHIRGGGFQGPDGFVFELCGGRLCLDFVNTLDERLCAEPKERLRTYKDLVDWSVQAEVLERRDAERLLERSRRSKARADAALGRALKLREALFEVFSSVIEKRPSSRGAKRCLDAELDATLVAPSLVHDAGGYRLDWREDPRSLHRMLPAVVHSAVALLTSAEDLKRVRQCSSSTCAWLYLDETRNHSRRWCDMAVCGNREKARRFYRRQKAKGV